MAQKTDLCEGMGAQLEAMRLKQLAQDDAMRKDTAEMQAKYNAFNAANMALAVRLSLQGRGSRCGSMAQQLRGGEWSMPKPTDQYFAN